MSNPTTPFGWQMPTATDLVTDLPADFEVFGQAVATSMADLLGGTTGQVLSKTSNTDMDFTWVAQDDSNAIQNSLLTTTGDTIYASGASTPARLGIGTTGQVLTVAAGVPSWAAVPSSLPASATATVATAQTTTSTSYTNLTTSGPAVTLTTGTKALVIVSAKLAPDSQDAQNYMDFEVSGATTRSASDTTALMSYGEGMAYTGQKYAVLIRASSANLVTLTAGSNTFTAKYRVTSNTGQWTDRTIFVMNLA